MSGQCGPKNNNIFSPSLPCAVYQPAKAPDTALRERLVAVCGTSFADPLALTCCDQDQLDTLATQTEVAYNLIGACPACWKNFMQLFCQFTCSPNQATFVNVTGTQVSPVTHKPVATELNVFVDPTFGDGLYQSCKEVKFPSDNSFVMDLLGGGAQNYTEMLKFLGQERLGGSPFQINFPEQSPAKPMHPLNPPVGTCDAESLDERCSCVDCNAVCPILPDVPAPETGRCLLWGGMTSWPVILTVVYAAIIIAFCLALGVSLAKARRWEWGWWFNASNGYEPIPTGEEADGLVQPYIAEGMEESQTLGTTYTKSYAKKLHQGLYRFFYQLGYYCASYPRRVLGCVLIALVVCSMGWAYFEVETNPERLWVGPRSTSAQNKRYFDEHFGPFYRTQQLIFTARDDVADTPVVTRLHLRQLFKLQSEIRGLVSSPNNYTLDDFCFKPTGDACAIQSVTGYWQNDQAYFDSSDWVPVFDECTQHPSNCLPEFSQPLKPALILGGYKDAHYRQARALFVTYVLTNSLDPAEVAKRQEWEQTLLDFLHSVSTDSQYNWSELQLDYSTEISIEQELSRSTYTDLLTVALSYLAMFLYVSMALARFSSKSVRDGRFWVETKFGLGLAGIGIVLASVTMSVGILSTMGFKATLIIAEVIPFLVLAVGVDNIFLMVHELHRQTAKDSSLPAEQRIAVAVGRMGPSILLSALAETLAFGLGAFVTMPAVSVFALYAALAVWFDFVLQITAFVALLALDTRRTENLRADLWPWWVVFPVQQQLQQEEEEEERVPQEADMFVALRHDSWLQWFIGQVYAPLLTSWLVKWTVFVLFTILFCVNLAKLPCVELGLDQRTALPRDSYLVRYFDNLDRYFQTGPPVYFVTKHTNITNRAEQQALCGRFTTCDTMSLANILEQERQRPEVSYLAQPAAVWLDDYFHWLNPAAEDCCRVRQNGNRTELCGPWDQDCTVCWKNHIPAWNTTLAGLPQGPEFDKYVNLWLSAEPSIECPLAGAAAYSDAVAYEKNGDRDRRIVASHIRTYHTPLSSQRDLIGAFQAAHRIAADASAATEQTVFPYSMPYIFFDQYAHIERLAVTLLGVGTLAIFGVTWLLLARFRVALLTMMVVLMILVQVIAGMAAWGVSLNAISLVNLMISLGISVEFCCHISRRFVVGSGKADDRMVAAMADAGSSVFSGIALTKFCGILVLAFARSKIFEVFYFRMYLMMVVASLFHGLVFLPVVLATLADYHPQLPPAWANTVRSVGDRVQAWKSRVWAAISARRPPASETIMGSLDEDNWGSAAEAQNAERLVIRS
ncbi:niemann-Pick type C- protein 1 [Dimargaris verticillata]|uniref:Niemann-Pick type C- protein 1 n=1 Tax=Dimargaris verticillata TaxID=2761393 RepID=A0A9W8B2A1_9FUNG|nr:niemann-Pick type C- protein 1 [Dimargaris verticillata]